MSVFEMLAECPTYDPIEELRHRVRCAAKGAANSDLIFAIADLDSWTADLLVSAVRNDDGGRVVDILQQVIQ